MRALAAFALLCCLTAPGVSRAQTTPSAATSSAPQILTRDQAGPLLPPSVFFDGQIATVQTRNSAGLRLNSSKLLLAALVDSSGYSSGVRERYQGVLLLSAPARIGGKRLAPGAYGFGFFANNEMAVMDLGANDLLRTATTPDPALKRPTPLQMLPNPATPAGARLYLGRSFVLVEPAP